MNLLFKSFWKKIRASAAEVTWQVLLAFVLFHMVVSWWLLYFAGEDTLISRDSYLYFYITTALTVGYGDLSPKTEAGRLVAVFWLMPGSISVTAALIGKVAAQLVEYWRRGMNGQRDYFKVLNAHTVVLGWHSVRTIHMIRLLSAEMSATEKIVLGVAETMENPFPENILFVRAESLACLDMMQRTSVADARKILIYGKNDEETLATALCVAAQSPVAHVVAHFEDGEKAALLKSHCPGIEVIVDLSVELLVRSAQDPGSSLITTELVTTLAGPTQYCTPIPAIYIGMKYQEMLVALKRDHDATLIGLAGDDSGKNIALNPPSDLNVADGWFYYISSKRLSFARSSQ